MRLFSFFLCLLLCIACCSCGAGEKTAEEVLSRLMTEAEGLPKGTVYSSRATEGEEGYMPSSLIEAMYGEDRAEYFSLAEDYAIYLSDFAEPYEMAVFRCYSRTDAIKLELMCIERRDLVSVALRETSFYELCDDIRVIRKGRYAIFLLTDSPDRMARVAKGLIT